MRDNPGKRPKSGLPVSWPAHELDAVQKEVRKEMPKKRARQIQSALDRCKRYIEPSEGRDKLLTCIREKLQ